MSNGETTSQKHQRLMPPWAPGQSGNPAGRPKGSRHRLDQQFVDALHADFQEYGSSAIAEVRTKHPHIYLKVIAAILPKQIEVKPGPFDGFTDEHLAARVDAARSALGVAEDGGAREVN